MFNKLLIAADVDRVKWVWKSLSPNVKFKCRLCLMGNTV